MGNNHVKWNVTRGCYLIHNCSHAVVPNQTRITIVNYQETYYFSSDAQLDFELEKDHMDKFVKTSRETDETVDHNEKQVQSTHQTLLDQEKLLVHKTAELYNMVGLLRADVYWNKELEECDIWDQLARTAQFDFVCYPVCKRFHRLKVLWFMIFCLLLVPTIRISFFF